jgi:PAS domain S-box-containing protein
VASDAELSRLLTTLPVGVLRVVDGRIAFANEAAARMFGEPADALAGRVLFDFVAPEERDLVVDHHQHRLRGERAPGRYVVTHVRKDGARRRIEVEPVVAGPGETVNVLRDITDVVEQSVLVVALNELAAKVQSARSVGEVFEVAGRGLLALGMSAFGVRYDAPDVVIESVEWDPDTGGDFERVLGQSLAGMRLGAHVLPVVRSVIESRRSQYHEDIAPTIAALFGNFGVPPETRFARDTDKLLLAPLLVRDRVWGLLGVTSPTLSADDAAALTLFAAQISSSLDMLDSFADLDRTRSMLQVLFELGRVASEVHEVVPLAERVVLLLGTAMSADGARLYLLDAAGERLTLGSWRETGESSVAFGGVPLDGSTLVGRVAVNRQTETVDWRRTTPRPGTSVVRHEVAAPLVAGDRLVGVLSLLRRTDRPFEEEEVRLLESSAAQTALAIERARLFEGAQRRVEELQLLLDVGRVITASLDQEVVLERAAGILARFVEVSGAFIMLLDPDEPVLAGAACSDERYREHFRGVRIGLERASIAADAVGRRGPVAVPDVTKSDRVVHDLVDRYGSKSLLAIPLLSRDQPIGCVVLHDSGKLRNWTDAEIQRASLIANQLGVAVANARLYEDLKESYGELARAQEELVKRERLAALGELAAVVAHEVRNPVAVIFNALSALRKILKLTGDAAMLLGIVGEEADRLNRIVGDLLDFARPSEPALAPEPLDLVIRDTVEAAASEPAAQPVIIKTHVAPEMPDVRIDARMVRQALLNVVINGLQAMPRGGTLTVAAATDMSNGRRWARLEVRDTGPGVPPELAGKIFQPFFTTKATGTGLGLAVVKRIMEAHRGEVLVESRAGEGTKVSLLLPMEDDA